MCQEIIPRINGSHKKTKPCRTHAVHAVKWKITKLFIRNINLAAINWSVDPLTSIYLYLICVYQIRMQRGKKKKQNGVGNLRFHCFLHTNQSLGVYRWQADCDIPSTASPQQDFCALCWPFLLNSDTKRMYKLGNQRIIKECHYNYQSLKASQQYSRLKFHIIYFIFKSPDICDPLSKYGGGGGGGFTLSTRCSTQDILSPLTQGKTLGSQMLLKPLLTGKASFAKSHIF